MRGSCTYSPLVKVSWEHEAKTPTATIMAVILHKEEVKAIV